MLLGRASSSPRGGLRPPDLGGQPESLGGEGDGGLPRDAPAKLRAAPPLGGAPPAAAPPSAAASSSEASTQPRRSPAAESTSPPPRRPQRRLPPGARSLCSLVQRNRPRHEGAPPALLSRTSRPRRETLPNAARHSSRRSTPPAPNEPAFDIRAPHPSLLKRERAGEREKQAGRGRRPIRRHDGVWCVVCGVGPT